MIKGQSAFFLSDMKCIDDNTCQQVHELSLIPTSEAVELEWH